MSKLKPVLCVLVLLLTWTQLPTPALAQEKPAVPYFVTYSQYLEQPDELEIATQFVRGRAGGINTFLGDLTEFEYGATKWWTTELYLDWQHTHHEGYVWTGVRWENRFRPFLEEHRINPVLYVEYEHLNGADKTLHEIVGFDGKADLAVPNSVLREETEHEFETKLILGSQIGEWNLSENFIGVKNIHEGRWEFGYAAALSRPLAARTGRKCTFCAERFAAGVEAYGGLGEWGKFTMRGTSQYVAPALLWSLPSETTFKVSFGWGVTDEAVTHLFRFGVEQEFDDVGRRIGKLFGK